MFLFPGILGAPFSGLYGAGVLVRRAAYDAGICQSTAPEAFTVCVGGLEAGGVGKTPVAAWFLQELQQTGAQVGLLSRGYGRSSRAPQYAAPEDDVEPLVLGDEPAMLREWVPGIHVVADVDRVRGAATLVKHGVRYIVMDDGFSHRRLQAHCNVVVLRGEAPLGSGHFLPWGTLREPRSSLGRAQVVWFHYRRQGRSMSLPAWAPKNAVQSVAGACQVSTLAGDSVDISGKSVVLACGIARPQGLADDAKFLGASIVGANAYRDHYQFAQKDILQWKEQVRSKGAIGVLVTPKDAIKLSPWDGQVPILVVRREVRIVSGEKNARMVLEKASAFS